MLRGLDNSKVQLFHLLFRAISIEKENSKEIMHHRDIQQSSNGTLIPFAFIIYILLKTVYLYLYNIDSDIS